MSGHDRRDILRLTTAGSVDDGKSTLIGRLLWESKAIYQDQLEAVTAAGKRRGDEHLDFALFTDGLKAEREQRITIDVAYRYFSTPMRKFIIADCPGHLQYTRNMVTGASSAELAVVLVDASRGLTTQSRRHAVISSLLRIPHMVVVVNKMDLMGYRRQVFEELRQEFTDFCSRLEVRSLNFIPISALKGDNVVERSAKMEWYNGSTFLHYLERVKTGADLNLVDFRLPIQYVIRPDQHFRGFAGRIASGRLRVGEEVVALPSGLSSRVKRMSLGGRELEECFAGDSVLVELEDEIDVSRGDLLVRRQNLPERADHLDTTVCWLSEEPMQPQRYILKLATKETRSEVARVDYLINVDTMHREEAVPLELNDIARLQIKLTEPIYFDPYSRIREMGSFVLIDPVTHGTVAAGMIRGETPDLGAIVDRKALDRNLRPTERLVSTAERVQKRGHRGGVVWLTGLSGSGKSTIAKHLERRLFDLGREVVLLDGDSVRTGLCADLGFGEADRRENVRRVGELAALLCRHGVIVIAAFISPYRRDREALRERLGEDFREVFVECSLAECEARDPKGLYAKARAGAISRFTGIDSPYERPLKPDLSLDTQALDLPACVELLLEHVEQAFSLPNGDTASKF